MADIVIVGAGPAGLAAAAAARSAGADVTLVDDNPACGGQIWRGDGRPVPGGVEWIGGTRVACTIEPGLLLAEDANGSREIRYRALIIATGARERYLPFPGWTQPHVLGAGGLQAMVKGGLPVAGKRVIVAGSGPLLLAVAAYLRKRGAAIPLVAEQAAARDVRAFARSLWRHPAKLIEGAKLRAGLRYRTDSWVTQVEECRVTVSERGRDRVYDCDYLATGFGLVPNTELAAVLGCRVDEGGVIVDTLQRTTVSDIFCAGEPTGVGGVDLATIEGRIAGLAAVGDEKGARQLTPARDKANRFRLQLDRAFRLRPELSSLARPGTIVCRCEDVRLGTLLPHRTWRAMKLQTRCGMGPCQGRICGPAVEHLLGCAPDSVRPPVFPVRVSTLIR